MASATKGRIRLERVRVEIMGRMRIESARYVGRSIAGHRCVPRVQKVRLRRVKECSVMPFPVGFERAQRDVLLEGEPNGVCAGQFVKKGV